MIRSNHINYLYILKKNMLALGGIEDITNWNKLFFSLVSGQTILLIDGCDRAIGCAAQGGELRAITEPTTEPAVRGA
ncbi:hypothetical protein GCM10020331_060320 [Ectobacillus funiculus]